MPDEISHVAVVKNGIPTEVPPTQLFAQLPVSGPQQQALNAKANLDDIGTLQDGKFISQPDAVQIQGPGSTGAADDLTAKSPGALVARPLSDRDVLSANDFGVDLSGATDATPKLQALLHAVAARGGGIAYVQAGTPKLSGTSPALHIPSKVRLVGAGRGATIFKFDDTVGSTFRPGIDLSNVTDAGIEHCGIQGSKPFSNNQPRHLIYGQNVKRVSVRNCAMLDSSLMGVVFLGGDQVDITDNLIRRTAADGVSVQDVTNALVSRNTIIGANDDAISAHVNDYFTGPLRAGLVITDNRISESQGIAVYGAKAAVITGNVMRRMMSYGLIFDSSASFQQGNSPQFAVTIASNTITDVFARSGEAQPRNGFNTYMLINGGPKQAGTGNSAAPRLYGSGEGNLYAKAGTSSVPSPGGYWWNVTGNTLVRTKPASTSWSAWGDVDDTAGLYPGWNNNGGLYTGGITEAALQATGITIRGPLANSRIGENIIQTTGTYGILFDLANPAPMDFDGLTIENNQIADFVLGIHWPQTGAQRARIVGNTFDGDPRNVHAARTATGGWSTTSNAPQGVFAPSITGLAVERNSFRNLAAPVALGAFPVVRGNLAYGEPAAVGFSTSNRGLGVMPAAGVGWTHIVEDSNPASPTFRQVTFSPFTEAASMPSSGLYVAGHTVTNAAPFPNVETAWTRLTTGSGHVDGVDWFPVGRAPAWVDYTPTLSAGSGSLGSATASGRYQRLGKTLHLRLRANIADKGTATGVLMFTLPPGMVSSTAPQQAGGIGNEGGATNFTTKAYITPGETRVFVTNVDRNSIIDNGYQPEVSITLEVQ